MSKDLLVALSQRVIAVSVACSIPTPPAAFAPVNCQASVVAPEFGSCSGWSVTPGPLDFGTVAIGHSSTRSIHIAAPANCIYSGARMDVILSGPDVTFTDGTYVQHVGLDLAVNWTFDVRFTPTVDGEESFDLVTYRACGPPGTPAFPCQRTLGRGVGSRVGASLLMRWPAAWRPGARK